MSNHEPLQPEEGDFVGAPPPPAGGPARFKVGDRVDVLAPSKGPRDQWTGKALYVVGVPARATGAAQDYALSWIPNDETDVFIVEARLALSE